MIQSLERAIKILRLAAASGDGIRLRDLALACELKRNTVFNLADTLVKENMLTRTSDGRYAIGDLVRELAEGWKRGDFLKVAEETLRALHLKYPKAGIFYSELGRADIFAKFYFAPNDAGKARFPEGLTLNAYLTVCGLVFFAFAPDESLIDLRAKNPFEYHGLNAWGDSENFRERIELTRKNGYAETPNMAPPPEFKVGFPVWRRADDPRGAVTFHLKQTEGVEWETLFRDVKSHVDKLNGQ